MNKGHRGRGGLGFLGGQKSSYTISKDLSEMHKRQKNRMKNIDPSLGHDF